MFEKLKFLLLLIVPIVLIVNVYILVGILYNNIRTTTIQIRYDDVKDYLSYDGIEKEIVDTNTFKSIFRQVFVLNSECEIFESNCKTSKEILSIVDSKLDFLYKELDYTNVSKKELKSSTFIILNELYRERTGISSDRLVLYDQIFDLDVVKSALYIDIVLILITLILSITNWLKYNGLVLIASSTTGLLAMIFIKLITLFMTASGKRIILAIFINRLSDICVKSCYRFLIIGFVLLIVHFIYNKIVKSFYREA